MAQSATITDRNAIDDQIVDQGTYTSFERAYPEGDLWWRVQAIDSADNRLAWSETRKLVKATPATNLDPGTPAFAEHPVDQAATPAFNSRQGAGATLFQWTASDFDSTWEIEVYRNDDTTLSEGNRVLHERVKQAAFAPQDVLPPSSQPYRWRIKRTDVTGQAGRWSDFGRFFVDALPMSLSAPDDGAVMAPNGVHLAWQPLASGSTQAAKYVVALDNVSGGGGSQSVTTSATAYSVTDRLESGTYSWTVKAYDSANRYLGTSPARRFVVDAAVRAVSPVQIHAPTGSAVGQVLTSTPPQWSQPDVASSYQWLRDGNEIGGATGPTYRLQIDDYTRVISLRVIGRRPAYTDGTTVSNVFSVSAGGALQNVGAPVISGSATVGSSLSVTTGTWAPGASEHKYQWLRQGAPIPGATGSSYALTAQDAGRDLSVTVLASARGFGQGAATTAAVAVARLKSTVTGALKADRVKVGKRAVLGVTVSVPHLTSPTGVVQVLDKGKKIAQLTLAPASKGVVTVRLPKLKKGKHKLQVVYLGAPTVFGSKSKQLILYVGR